jgi:CubicO group peptidase (beta-lactamase class C family)
MFDSYVESGVLAGVVSLVSRRGEARVEVLGAKGFGGEPMQRDSLFRVASFTKPIVAAAAMILVDENRLRLDDPLTDLLPELAGMRVLKDPAGPVDDTVAAEREITLRDLLTLRLGLGESGNQALREREGELELRTFGPPKPRSPLHPDEWMRRLGTLPLQYQPGERWLYSTGSHVLGVLVARATGQPLESFLRERLFGPLGMKDTSFTAVEADRLTTAYAGEDVFDSAVGSQWLEPPSFPDAGGGLISTADDFHAFASMLLAGGNGILSAGAVEQMTTDALSTAQREAAVDFLGPGTGWGLGLSVGENSYGWAGGLGTIWSTTPDQQTISILLTQRALWTWPPELFEEANSQAS